jgi:PKD domain
VSVALAAVALLSLVLVPPALGADSVFWANNGNDTISFAKLDGSGGGGQLSTAGATLDSPAGVAIDPAAGRIYWANFGIDSISFASLDGSGGGQLSTAGATMNNPNFPALLRAPAGAGAPVLAGGDQVGQELSCGEGSWAPDLLGSFLYRAPRSFAYQWQRDGADIAGATSATYTPTEPGSYSCRVTASNQAGSASQASVARAVAANPQPGDCPAVASSGANYTPQQSIPGRRVPGVRAKITVDRPSGLQISPTLRFRRGGHRRSVNLGDRTLANPGTRNLRLPLPASLRDDLPLRSKVALDLKITSTPDSSPGCARPTSSELNLRTRVVKVLAAPQT